MPVRALITERRPSNPVSPIAPPAKSTEYPVGDGEDWKSVAKKHNLDVQRLIHHNFKTNNSDEVNWYLREYVGCIEHTPDRLNWKFGSTSKSKYPTWVGKIFIPTERYDFKGTVMTSKKITSPLALAFQVPGDPLARVGQFFDVFTLFDAALTILGIEFGAAFMLGAGITVTVLSPWVILGGLAEPALNALRKKYMLEGFSLGVVLGAQGKTNKWIAARHEYFNNDPIRDLNYPDYGKQFRGLYNQSFVLGLANGREFNLVAKVNFFEFCWSQMTSYAKDEYADYFKEYGDVDNWSPRKQENFYKLCAAILAKQFKI